MKLALLIDTTLDGVTLGLGSPKEVLWWDNRPQGQSGSEGLSLLLAEGLKETGSDIQDIDQLCVCSGPGSFTGIKVGLAFAYGFSSGSGGKVSPSAYSSLSACLDLVDGCDAVLLPSTRDRGAVALREGGEVMIKDFKVGDLDLPGKVCLVRPWPLFEKNVGRVELLDLDKVHRCSMEAALIRLNSGTGDDTVLPAPNYLRLSTAEEKLANVAKGVEQSGKST